MESWEIIADNLKKRGWSLGYVSAIDSQGRTIWITDAHRGDGKRFVARADDKLTAFLELKRTFRRSRAPKRTSVVYGGECRNLGRNKESKLLQQITIQELPCMDAITNEEAPVRGTLQSEGLL